MQENVSHQKLAFTGTWSHSWGYFVLRLIGTTTT